MQKLPTFQKKAAGKIATTGYVNKVVDLAVGMAIPFETGVPFDPRSSKDVHVAVLAVNLGNGWYTATLKEGPVSLGISESDPPSKMQDGTSVLVFIPLPEASFTSALDDSVFSFSAGHPIVGLFIGFDSDTGEVPVLYDISSRIIDERWSDGTATIDVTFDGDTWIPKVVFVSCPDSSTSFLLGL